MKALLMTFILLLCFTGYSKKLRHATKKSPQTAEGIKIGMPTDEAIQLLSKEFIIEIKHNHDYDDAPGTIEYVVRGKKKDPLFSFNAGYESKNAKNVFRIVLSSPKYTTPEGIRVGMTVEELKAKAALKSADFNYQDGLFLLSSTFDGGFWIKLDSQKDYSFSRDSPSISDIPSDLTIKGIIIF